MPSGFDQPEGGPEPTLLDTIIAFAFIVVGIVGFVWL
jgi:hypothetical protein